MEQLKVLVVDDEPEIADLVTVYLRGDMRCWMLAMGKRRWRFSLSIRRLLW